MKIVYDHQIFSLQMYGGISRYYFELASNLSNIPACDVKICSPIYINEYLRAQSIINVIGKYIHPFQKTARLINVFNNLVSIALLGFNKPDIIHKTYYGKELYNFSKIKSVLTVFDMINEKCSDDTTNENITALKKKAVARADHIICISEHTRKDLLEIIDVDPPKVSVVHLGYSFSIPASEKMEKIIQHPYLLYVGKRGGYKNFERLLNAYAGSKRLKKDFCLVCFGGGNFISEELDYIDHLGISKGKILYCSGDDTLLAKLYSHASAFVYPSLYEGFGIPLLEAMSFKCPVICSNTSSIPEVAGDAAEYFDPFSVENMMDAIEKVVYFNDKTEHLVSLGLTRIEEFSWEKCAIKTKSIYSSLL
ncbi:MAG: glycosyltransferase family 4 protein [Desulfobacteraceae bacterium]|nr:glycosyltransferase family 4 protein [Desulfobacteraceae bacterium]